MELLFLLILLIISMLYASVGHGGASGYLALMALFGIAPSVMRPSALTLNLLVSLIAFLAFYKGGYFKWKLLLPFIVASIPMAYIGASMKIDPSVYKYLLGICLMFGVARMLLVPHVSSGQAKKELPLPAGLLIGAILGFVSGLIGIGGGIILSPLLLMFRWADIKETAAVSAIFIFLNSASGLVGLTVSGLIVFNSEMLIWVFVAAIGGIIGSFAGSFKLNDLRLKHVLAGVLLLASMKLLLIQ